MWGNLLRVPPFLTTVLQIGIFHYQIMTCSSVQRVMGLQDDCTIRKEKEMFYRVAIRPDVTAPWKWRSTPLSSRDALFAFLRLYQSIPMDRLQVFSARTREELNAQLEMANRDLAVRDARRVTASLSMQGAATGSASAEEETRASEGSQRNHSGNTLMLGASINVIEKTRIELESGKGGDHDTPYLCTLPTTTPQMMAWIHLRNRVQNGELQA